MSGGIGLAQERGIEIGLHGPNFLGHPSGRQSRIALKPIYAGNLANYFVFRDRFRDWHY